MSDKTNLNDDETRQARTDVEGYRPRWCAKEPEVTFLDVLRARAADPHSLTLVSVQLALRGTRLEENGSVAVVPAIWNPSHLLLTSQVTRLVATWPTPEGSEPGRGQVYVLTGLDLDQAKGLGGHPGLPWLLFAGPETEGRVHLLTGDQVEDMGMFDVDLLLAAIGRAVGAPQVELERPPMNWIEGMLAARFEAAGGRLPMVSWRELWPGP